MVIASDRLAESTGTPPDCQAACLAARPVGLIEAINCFDLPAVLPQHQPTTTWVR